MSGKVELKNGNSRPSFFANLSSGGRSFSRLTYKEIYECVEPGLKTEEQKNAVKAVLNALGRKREDHEISHSVLSDLSEFYAKNSKLKDAKVNTSASELMEKLKSRIEEVVNSDPQKKVPNLKIALNNINKDLKMARTNKTGKLEKTGNAAKIVKERINLMSLLKGTGKTSGTLNVKKQKKAVNTSGSLNVSEGSVQKKGRRSL